ncbi:MAG: SDR family oxidoreductase [Potamolinea sp.]
MQAFEEALPKCELISPRGLYLITEDEFGVAPLVCEALQQKGTKTAIIPRSTLAQNEQLASIVAQQRQIHGAVTGVIHLAPLVNISICSTISEFRLYNCIQTKSFFQLLQLCSSEIQAAGKQQQGRVIAASLFGGYFGRQGNCDTGLPTGGSSTGLLKTLIAEWSGVHGKAIDFDNSLSPQEIAQHIVNELLLPGGRVEVGYPEGKRTVFKSVLTPLNINSPQLTASADWVVLVTGGGRGITAEITEELIIPGMRLIVVGRSPEPGVESSVTAGISEIKELRQALLQEARTQGLSLIPIQIERQLLKILGDRAIRRNLERFRKAGARVEYLAVDVRNSQEFGLLLDGIYEHHQRLDAVIHGSGIIEDKLIVDKPMSSFERVFDTKVDSTFILSRHLRPDSLKLLVLFSSIAGRYGNRGQSDYAAANEVMNRFAWYLDRTWSNTRVVSINWGPWDTIGMASETVKQQLRERGIIPIPLAAGRQFFIDELRYGKKGETEVIGGEGPWEADEARQGEIKTKKYLFLSKQPQLQPNSTVTLEHTFSWESDPYLSDYCIDGKTSLPKALILEWMTEFVQAAWTEWKVTQAQDLKTLQPLIPENTIDKTILFSARSSTHADAESLQIAVEILDSDQKIPLYRAYLNLQPHIE